MMLEDTKCSFLEKAKHKWSTAMTTIADTIQFEYLNKCKKKGKVRGDQIERKPL